MIKTWLAKRFPNLIGPRPLCPRCNVRGWMNDPLRVVWTCTKCLGWFNVDRPEAAGCVLYGGGFMWRTEEAQARFDQRLAGFRTLVKKAVADSEDVLEGLE